MRILHIDSGLEMRGGQWQVCYLLNGLRDRGIETRLLARGALLERASAAGFETAPLSGPAVLRWRSWADLVHAHDARSHTMAAVLARRPLVVSRRVAFPIGRGILSRWKYRQVDAFIVVSEFVAAIMRDAGIKCEALSVVYDGVPVAAQAGAGEHTLVIAPATADPIKGSDLAREAANLAGVPIVFSDDLPADLGRAAVLLYISRSEGLGSAAVLAMARGVPVVASRIEGLMEAVEDGVTGLLVDNDAAKIAQGLKLVLDDPALRRQMGQAGRERVARQFSVERMVEQTMEVYGRLRG